MNKILTLAALLILPLVAACSSDVGLQNRTADNRMNKVQGGSVEVKPGDTVYSIARRNNVPMSAIIRENKLQQPYVLQPGQTIRVPGASLEDSTGLVDNGAAAGDYVAARDVDSTDLGGSAAPAAGTVETTSLTPLDAAPLSTQPVERAGRHDMILTPTGPVTTPPPGEVQVPSTVPNATAAAPPAGNAIDVPEKDIAQPAAKNVPYASAAAPAKGTFAWPVEGHPSGSGSAVEISAPKGTAVTAASGGTVASVNSDSVTIQHASGYTSTYSPLERVLVDKDAIVAKGDAIGTLGSGGGSGKAAQLHFAIAKDGQPVDPIAALPAK